MVMRQMRENTKWIMLVTALAFVGLMVFQWGMDLTGRSSAQASGGEIGSVNGESVPYQEYITTYRNLYGQQSASGQPISSSMNEQIEDEAWNQVVMQRLIAQELDRRGIEVTADEIRQAARYAPPPEIMGSPQFQTDGKFDLEKYHQLLSSPAVPPQLLLQLESYYRNVIPRSKLYFQSTAGVYVTDDELWRMWRDTHEKASVEFIAFDPSQMVPDGSVSVTPAEIATYYKAHEQDFVRPAQANVKYVVLDRSPTAADSAASLEQAEATRQELASGASFDSVAHRLATDTLNMPPVEATIARGQTYPALEQAVFSLPAGRVSEPILTPDGYHIIEVKSRQADTASVNHILVPVTRTVESEDALLARADTLDDLAENLQLEEIASRMGLQVRDAQFVPGLSFLTGVGQADEGTDWAFHDAQPGEVSQVFDTPSAFYIIQLVDRTEERTLTREEAEPTIRAALVATKKIEAAKQKVREAVEKIRGGQSMEQVAAAYDAEVQKAGPFTRGEFVPGLGRLNPAIGTAFGLKEGETSGVVESDRNLYIIRTTSREPADREEWEKQKAEQRQAVVRTLADQHWNEFLAALRDRAKIVDLRDQLQQQSAAQQQTS